MSRFIEHDYEQTKRNVLVRLRDRDRDIYVEAWKGVGATALLREVAEEVESNWKDKFETVIKVMRPAPFENPREIQRAVAKQLNLPPSVTDILDARDEDDDFSSRAEFRSRDLVSEVTEHIYRAVGDRIVLFVFCNNIADDNLIDPNKLGIENVGRWIHSAVLWTTGMNISRGAADLSAGLSQRIKPGNKAEALDIVYKEAAEIARYIEESSSGKLRTTPQLVVQCFWYCILLCSTFNRSKLINDWQLEAVKYFVCEGILQGDAAWEIGRALAPLIGPIIKHQLQYWEKTFSTLKLMEKKELLPPKTLLIGKKLPLEEEKEKEAEEEGVSYRWISVSSSQNKNIESWDFFKIYLMSEVSSFFGHFQKTHEVDLPDGFFDRFSNIRVLDLLGCIVSPINSSFLSLRNLRMLRLEKCSVDPSSLSSAQEEKREQQAISFDSLWFLNLSYSDADTFLLAGKAFKLMPNLLELCLQEKTSVLHLVAPNEFGEHMHKLEVVKLSGDYDTEFLPRSLSMAINLKELMLDECEGLQYLNFNLPATIETIILVSCTSLEKVELVDPTAAPLPNLKTFHLSDSELIAKLSLQGCRKLENVDLQELTGLEVLNLSCTAIKVVDITELPHLKQLFLLGCEQLCRVDGLDRPKLDVLYLDNYNSSSACDVDHCLDSFQNQSLPDLIKGTNDADQRLFQAHVVVRDVRIFRTIYDAFPDLSRAKALSHIHVKSSSTTKKGINNDTTTKSNATITLCYADVLDTMTDLHHQLSPPTMPLNNHIEVDGDDDSGIVNEFGTVKERRFELLMKFANSLFVHDNTSNLRIDTKFEDLKCLRIERCPNLEFIFYSWDEPFPLVELESIWLSQLPRLKALHEKGRIKTVQLKHIYLEFCARLEYVLTSLSELHNLETINIRYCNDLTAIFKSDKDERGDAPMLLPNLRSIHLQELPKLQHIYKQNIPAPSLEEHIYKLNICAPSLKEIKIRGCFNLRKLPLFDPSNADSMRAVKISCEKDWWDKLQWDGSEESNHHASLFNPIHCPYYKKPMKARWL